MKKNVMWNTIGSIFYCFCQWLITVVVVHLDSYETAGYLSLAMTSSSSFSAIALFSMRNYQVSDVKAEYNDGVYVGSRIITSILAFTCCTVTGFWGNSIYQGLCISAFMLIRVAEALVDVMHGIDQKYDRYDYIGKSYILRGVGTIVVFVAGMLIVKNLAITLYIMAFINLLIAVGFDWRLTHKMSSFTPQLWNSSVQRLLRSCIPIVGFTFLLNLENLLPKNVLQQMYGAEELGIYSTIASPTLVVQVCASVVFNPFLPEISKEFYSGNMNVFSKMLHKVYLLLGGMTVIVLLGAELLGRIGLKILFGNSILTYYDLFMPIVLCTIMTAMVWVISAILVALRKTKYLLIGMIIDFIMCLILLKPIIGAYDKNGVSFIQIIVLAIYILFMIIVCEATVYKQKKCGVRNEK